MSCSCHSKKPIEKQSKNNIADITLLDEIINKYKGEAGCLISVLQEAQDIYSYLPLMVIKHIARELKIKPAKVYGVVTFYTQFRLRPVGKYHILLCHGTACHVNGSEKIEAALSEELGIEPGDTTQDDLFTLDSAACLGCCSLAPVMMINGQAYGPLNADKAVKIIRDIYASEKLASGEGEII